MSLLDAPQYDARRERRRKLTALAVVLAVMALALAGYLGRNWRYERVVDKFFTRLEQKDYEGAYGIWMADGDWKQHPEKFARYPYGQFYLDWGPSGEWGVVKSHKIEGAARPQGGGSGVVVVVTVNERVEKARIWVEKSDMTLTFSPY